MPFPGALEQFKKARVWVCYPLIWDDKLHNGFGGYAKPPISPHTLRLAKTNDPETLGTYEQAAARVGESIVFEGIRTKLEGVGICLQPAGLVCVDLDSFAQTEPARYMTPEAGEIIKLLNTYTELTPSSSGFHCILSGSLEDGLIPCKKRKGKKDINGGTAAEIQVMNSGYVTLTGNIILNKTDIAQIEDRCEALAELYRVYMKAPEVAADPGEFPKEKKAEPKKPEAKGNSIYTWERWLTEIKELSDEDLLQRIYATPRIGQRVRDLYEGGYSGPANDGNRNHSAKSGQHCADMSLMMYLYGFTHDEETAMRLFSKSSLYRGKGSGADKKKSSNYYSKHTLPYAVKNAGYYIGKIEPTKEERRAYAEAMEEKEQKELAERRKAREEEARHREQ